MLYRSPGKTADPYWSDALLGV